MPKFTGRERVILGLTITALGLFLGDRCIVRPVSDAWAQLNVTVSAKRDQLAHDRLLLAESEQIKRDFKAYAVPAGEANEKGASGTQTLREIAALARQSGVKIKDIRPQGSGGHTGSSASMFLSVESRWDSLARFIYQVQRSGQFLQIEQARVQRKGDDAASVTAQFVIGSARVEEL